MTRARTPSVAWSDTEALHTRIAAVLGWSEADVRSFSLVALREAVREHPKLVREIDLIVRCHDRLIVGAPRTKGGAR